jgi:hypothetical protein
MLRTPGGTSFIGDTERMAYLLSVRAVKGPRWWIWQRFLTGEELRMLRVDVLLVQLSHAGVTGILIQ